MSQDNNTWLTPEEALNLLALDTKFQQVEKIYDEQLVTDYIMIGGYTTEEAYAAADSVAQYDDLF